MKIRHLIKTLGGGALVAAVLAFSSSANALVTQLIHFDDAGGGSSWYSDADKNFLFDPTNLSNTTLCADTTGIGPSANGQCVLEAGQTNLPLMTRPSRTLTSNGEPGMTAPLYYESGDSGPTTSDPGDLQLFNLDAFYFLLNGQGMQAGNYIEVTGTFADNTTATATFLLGQIYANVTNYDSGLAAGALDFNTGYVASFDTTFDNVKSIQFLAFGSAQTRIDCVVATHDGETTEALDSFDRGCGISTEVPEPSTLALLGLGLAGVGFARRRKKV